MSIYLNGMRVPAGTGFSGLIARERKAQTIEGDLPFSPFPEVIKKEGTQALSGVPLLVDKRLLGVLCIGSKAIHAITEDDLRFLSLVGDRIAVSIERVRLYIPEKDARAQAEEDNQSNDQVLATGTH